MLIIISGLLLLWSALACYWLAPELISTAIQHYDMSDMLLSSLIIIMAIGMLAQQKQINQAR